MAMLHLVITDIIFNPDSIANGDRAVARTQVIGGSKGIQEAEEHIVQAQWRGN
jgi:hypothetical protein